MTTFCHFSCDFIVSSVFLSILFYCTVFYYHCSSSVVIHLLQVGNIFHTMYVHAIHVEAAKNKGRPGLVRGGRGIASPVLLCRHECMLLLASRLLLKRCLAENVTRHRHI